MSEDVSRFLSQVKELGERRIEEDEARSRELEEKILQERKERQARRAALQPWPSSATTRSGHVPKNTSEANCFLLVPSPRVRSISPQKDSSPANTPPPSTHRTSAQGPERLNLESSPVIEPPGSPQSRSSLQSEDMAAPAGFWASASKENESPFDAEHKPASPLSPTRSGSTARGLSWQKRPNSQASERSRSRPLSVFAAQNAARSSNNPPEPTSATESVSRDQIASALSSKDPSWFRQTADRGANSAAYRRSQVEDKHTVDMSAMQSQLPGMSRATSGESAREETVTSPDSPYLRGKLASPLPLSSSQRLDPPGAEAQPETEMDEETQGFMPPPLRRSSPSKAERPISPTKGLGGFVQSAMMKRSDSVNKRWSVQSPAGLQRADSVVSNRDNYTPSTRIGASARSRSRPTSLFREASSTEHSRPGSSHGKEEGKASTGADDTSFKRKDTTSPEPQEQEPEHVTPPTSPSKTMDSRRWSPTKASWLESALNKPESPKPKSATPVSNQPAWMAELQKAKAQKTPSSGPERGRSPTVSHKHQVSIGGLMRSSAPGITAKPPTPAALHSPSLSTSSTTRPAYAALRKESSSSTTVDIGTAKPEVASENQPPAESSPTSTVPPPASKTKPETPPKKDFRANLRSRQLPSTSGSAQQPEFKNVFGNLRKTTTHNYVAPDELKDNILRGKSGLSATGGPQKSERKDEFKDAILAKKQEFQRVQSEGRGITRQDSVTGEKTLPEGLAKRRELGRSNTVKRDSATSDTMGFDSKRSSAVSKRDSVPEPSSSRSARFGSIGNRDTISEPTTTEPEHPSINAKRDSAQEAPVLKRISALPSTPTLSKETSAPGRLQGKIGGGVLANRFNPALAGLLARGPPGTGSGSGGASGSASETISQSDSTAMPNDNEAGSGPKLTHMTKVRARGPKRKAPTSAPVPAPISEEPEPRMDKPSPEEPRAPRQESPATVPKPQLTYLIDSSKKSYNEPPKPKRPQPTALVGSSNKSYDASVPDQLSVRTPKSGSSSHEQVAALAVPRKPLSPTKVPEEPSDPLDQPPSPRKLNMNRMSRFLDDSTRVEGKSGSPERPKEPEVSVRPDTSSDKLSFRLESQPQSPPLEKPRRPLPDPVSVSWKRQPSSDEAESTTATPEGRGPAMFGARPLPVPPAFANVEPLKIPGRSLPKEPERALPTPGPKSPASIASPMRSPTKQALDTSNILSDFFGSERPQRHYHVDAAELLIHRPNTAPLKIQTLSTQLYQFSADGKKIPVPTHRERTLFEREMYICSHTFTNEAGRKTVEVYFWAGDEVSQSTVEDASLFVSREARAMGDKLVKLRQGKETPEFIQALGGILITQRGSGNKYDSLAPHMICGRRYHGHVVFDEADFTPSAMCSGFPYLITQAGRCYLWKGKGSGVDELSCARLIGMDYALSGEMEEFEDGREPATFWDLFNGGSRSGSADHWRLKPNYDKYCSRLFCSDAASRQQVVELSPFAQTDLQPTGIYVIDAFFELYIVVGSRAQSQYASFHNALDFAQEYAILASGMEDRPYVPISTVVLEGIPRDMKSIFRKWRDAAGPTTTNPNAGLKRGRSLKVVSLNQALQALSD
ncbi:Uu.00g002690.m01.CDS01 [Anthostomella pinea]|uniref:Uu.00g002690.m01.CDS01 n=1 Tax=Anthostomella pinea TaxID=933095 RepID=A0AAI8VJN7_9PEZI|nr:Uu.00g002690.m01.CDS01 [Anthostomella pinea]